MAKYKRADVVDDDELSYAQEVQHLADVLMPEDFYRAEHQMIFAVMSSQSEANKPIDVVTLLEALNSLDQLDAVGGRIYGAS